MKDLTPKDWAESVALFRAEVIGGLVHRDLDYGELRQELVALTRKRFRPPGRTTTKTYAVSTLERWYYRYRKGGLEALKPQPRSDRGRARGLNDQQKELLVAIRSENPSASAPLILRTLSDLGLLEKGTLSASTLRRFYRERGLDRVSLRASAGRHRLRWTAPHPDALWHGDVCHGPSLRVGGTTRPLRIHALLDDATRYIVAIEAHYTEREQDMLWLLADALRRQGAPDGLYLDNGSTYSGAALRTACERLGVTLIHARPYDPQARGKMERFWRTLREGCVDFLPSDASLHDVNVRLWAFVDQHYHRAPHAGLMGKTPLSAYEGESRPLRVPKEQKLRTAFTTRARRRIKRDNTLKVDGETFELDQGFLAGRNVTVVRCRLDAPAKPWVEHDGRRFELHPVDPQANAKRGRKKLRPTKTTVDFDPSTAILNKALSRKETDQ